MPTIRSITFPMLRVEAPRPFGFGGFGTITGTVSITGTPNTPARRRVRLHDFDTARIVREVWSDAAGAYAFTRLAAGTYYVTAFDHTGAFSAVIADALAVTEG